MPRLRDELTIGEWAALALIAEHPTHGFAIARAMAPDGEVGQVWTLARPHVYHAVQGLERAALIEPTGTLRSATGPARKILTATPAGLAALADWLGRPVEHVRDARSLLMLKLLFLTRSGAEVGTLLEAQREQFAVQAERLAAGVEAAHGFERTLLLWRLESTTAAIRFIEALLAPGALAGPS